MLLRNAGVVPVLSCDTYDGIRETSEVRELWGLVRVAYTSIQEYSSLYELRLITWSRMRSGMICSTSADELYSPQFQ